jgi:hypothetical protein
MYRKLIYLLSFIFAVSMAGNASADLVAHLSFGESSSDTAHDTSGNGNDGTLNGNPQWVAGRTGGALAFDGNGDYVEIPRIVQDDFTLAAWIKTDTPGLSLGNQGYQGSGLIWSDIGGVANDFILAVLGTKLSFFCGNPDTSVNSDTDIVTGEWVHVAATRSAQNGQIGIYINGQHENTINHSNNGPLNALDTIAIGGNVLDSRYYTGLIDEVRIYNHVLSLAEVLGAMEGKPWPYALGPNPADGALHTDTWVTLSWIAGGYAVSHDVYMGENFDDVNNGTADTFRGNQTLTYYVAGFPGFAYPDGLVPGTTYYWRIDEVNDADPNSPWKGDVWSFSIPPKTAYFPDPADGAEFVELNAQLKWTAGFGARLHYIVFGEDFDVVSSTAMGVPNGTTTYNPGPLKLAKTYYWRVDEFDGAATHKGEVWSFTTEGAVSGPNPADGTVDVKPSVVLRWIAGAVAASHDVYFGSDAEAVANATKASPEYKGPKALGEESYAPGKLIFNTTYYWRVDEVNNASTDSPWAGNVWSFTTGDFFVIDDFEDYDAGDNQIWYAWHDGLGYGAPGTANYFAGNGTGAAVGDENSPSYTEETIVHGGSQSMPVNYDNNKQGYSKYSEVELKLTNQRDWTEQGVAELSLWFRGYPASTGSFVEAPAGTFTMTASGADIWNVNGVEADEFHFAYKTLTGAGSIVAKIQSVDNTNGWSKAGVMIRESLSPDSAHAFAAITPTNGVAAQGRPSTGGVSFNTNQTGVAAPYWVKLERSVSGLFTVSHSANGTTWQSVTGAVAQNIPMGSNVYIGLALTAHDAALTCQAVFSNVTTTGSVTGQWANQDIGIKSNDAEPLYVAVSNSAGAPVVVTHDNPAAAQIDTWTKWVIPLSTFADQGINLTNVDRIAIGLGTKGNTTIPGGSGKMFIDDIRLIQPSIAP